MSNARDLDALNKQFYNHQWVADWYAGKQDVFPEEQSFLKDYAKEITGARILDIGIGAGRSTNYLFPLAGFYVGVDYSQEMVRAASKRYPNANLEVRDARDLSAFADATFDLVMFSFNGIDCLSNEGRLQAMGEIKRVLKSGGIFAFSTHNRDRPAVTPFSLGNLNVTKNPITLINNLKRYCRGIINWRRSQHFAFATEDYAMRHDSGNIFEVPMYYISKDAQLKQLTNLGFQVERIYDTKGITTEANKPDYSSSWIFYVAVRQQSAP